MGRGDRGEQNKIWDEVPEENLIIHIKKWNILLLWEFLKRLYINILIFLKFYNFYFKEKNIEFR